MYISIYIDIERENDKANLKNDQYTSKKKTN